MLRAMLVIIALVSLPVAILIFGAIAFATPTTGSTALPDLELQAEQLTTLWNTLGWPGLIAGMVSLGLTVWRFFFSPIWNKWPRWVRYGFVILSAGGSAAIAAIVQTASGGTAITSAIIIAAVIKGLIAGTTMIGVAEGVKTYKSPHAKREPSLKVEIPGPDTWGKDE